jgi:hypothetical protein
MSKREQTHEGQKVEPKTYNGSGVVIYLLITGLKEFRKQRNEKIVGESILYIIGQQK